MFVFLTSVAIALENMILIGHFVKIGDFDIGYYSEFVIVCDTIIAFILILRKPNKVRVRIYGLCLILYCIINLLSQIIHPYTGDVVSQSAGWDLYYLLGQRPGPINIGLSHIKEIIHVICYVVIISSTLSLKDEKRDQIIENAFRYQVPFIWFGI